VYVEREEERALSQSKCACAICACVRTSVSPFMYVQVCMDVYNAVRM
jgi:hypothetical protein